ncbi:MAG: endo-beta-N-acetylglucosaminidase [Janthinobacterium lividum]
MKQLDFRLWTFLLALLTGPLAAQAQIEPAAQYTTLTPAQLMAWTSTGPTSMPDNRSTVPLATRQNALASQLNPAQSFSSKVNWCPDGMNNFVGYINEQPQFNLYNFTHWQYIDVLTWFASPIGIPCRPWVEASHRNGVKIIGTVFTDAPGFVTLIQKDASGNYIGAQKLVDVANYYGFDGWFFNEESTLTTAQATELRNLLKQLQTIKPAGMEIHWYDSMIPSGAVSYQNYLSANNAPLLQEGATRVSDAIFINYFWIGSQALSVSASNANAIGRSPYDVYTGADIWPGRNPQRLFSFYNYQGTPNTGWMDNYYSGGNLTSPLTSLAVFAPNITYNGGYTNFNSNPADYASFYSTEQRLFSGDDLDITTTDASTNWKGFGYYQPVRCAVTSLPFETNFCVGQGKIFATNGTATAKPWTDMAKQAIMPSWQWAKTGATTVSAGFDFSRAWYGGTSIKLAGSLAAGAATTVKLYQTKLPITATTSLDLIYKGAAAGASSTKLALYFSDNLAAPVYLDVPAVTDTLWTTKTLSLSAYATRELAIIGVQATSAMAVATYRFNLGKMALYNGTAAVVAPKANFTATATTVLTGQSVTFANSSTNATSYVWTMPGATPSTSTAIHPTVTYAAAGTYSVTLTASNGTTQDVLTRTAYITVNTAPPVGSNTSLSFDGSSKYVDCGVLNLSGAALSYECWVKPNSFKTTSPYISSLMGMEDGGANTALLRLGDGSLLGNQVQFVLQLGGTTYKVASTSTPANTPGLLTAGVWTHLAATYDGTTMKLYINGVLNASQSATGSVVANAAFTLGRNYAASRSFDGRLDEVRVWTRARTAAEVAASACSAGSTANLEAYWRCNESPALATTDVTGHGHTGNFVSMSTSDWSTDVPTSCGLLATATATARATGSGLQVLPRENPVPGAQAVVEIYGAAGQPVTLRLYNTLGALLLTQQVRPQVDGEQVTLPLPATVGLYVLQASSGSQVATARLVKE